MAATSFSRMAGVSFRAISAPSAMCGSRPSIAVSIS